VCVCVYFQGIYTDQLPEAARPVREDPAGQPSSHGLAETLTDGSSPEALGAAMWRGKRDQDEVIREKNIKMTISVFVQSVR